MKGPLEYATSIAHCDLGTIPKSSIGSGDDDPPKRAFDELSSLSIVIAEAGCNQLDENEDRKIDNPRD